MPLTDVHVNSQDTLKADFRSGCVEPQLEKPNIIYIFFDIAETI